ncbi:phosphotransferase family protein [Ornithinimicrobium sp. W1679]|uniref:phosphotransferase family protein n=1 Tax=Ornithinimicrobium sp. W1679 TaxID=3418770 RepID=UPI003CF0466B
METRVLARARAAFDLGEGDLRVTPGPRGAVGQVWRLEVGYRVHALKHVLTGPPPARATVEAELVLARAAAAAGVRLPASRPGRDGQLVVALPEGGWLRLYDWMDVRRCEPTVDADALGVLLARLHTVAPAVRHEPDGAPPQGWYEAPPGVGGWDRLAAEAVGAGTSWSSRLAAAVASISALSAALVPTDPDRLRLCHRDLHPENVLTDGSGELVVVDWDDAGPADPARELAGALVLCFHDGTPDLDAMRRAYAAYVEAGGPGRLRSRADFSMLLSTRFNFLHAQARVALDPTATPGERAWAEEEVDEGLRTLPTPELLDAVLDAVGRTSPVQPGGMPFSVS